MFEQQILSECKSLDYDDINSFLISQLTNRNNSTFRTGNIKLFNQNSTNSIIETPTIRKVFK